MSKGEMDAQEYEQGISTRTLEECELVSWCDRTVTTAKQTDRQTVPLEKWAPDRSQQL